MNLENSPNVNRIEFLSGKHDPKSVGLKFQRLPKITKQELDQALNKAGLDFEQHFGEPNCLDALEEEQRKQLSSLCADLDKEENEKVRKETIKAIIEILKA